MYTVSKPINPIIKPVNTYDRMGRVVLFPLTIMILNSAYIILYELVPVSIDYTM